MLDFSFFADGGWKIGWTWWAVYIVGWIVSDALLIWGLEADDFGLYTVAGLASLIWPALTVIILPVLCFGLIMTGIGKALQKIIEKMGG